MIKSFYGVALDRLDDQDGGIRATVFHNRQNGKHLYPL